ncbi:MAG: MFS transporter [Mucinivorans sp.]
MEKLRKTLGDSVVARWTVLVMVSLTMMCGYFLTDVMAPLEGLLSSQNGWTGSDYGFFNSAYGWLNFTLGMLIVAGIVLDKIGARLTGLIAVGVMLCGISIKYYAVGFMPSGQMVDFWFFGQQSISSQVLTASAGYSLFAVGYETIGITATKIIVRWFKGKGSLAFALGMNVAFARLGTAMAMALPLPLAHYFNSVSAPILIGLLMLCVGFICFVIFVFMDRKLDRERAQEGLAEDEKFRFRDIFAIFRMRGFWYISFLCFLFYSAVFPFLKFATLFLSEKFAVDPNFAGTILAMLPFGTILLTPLFGRIYDKRGQGITIMLIGSSLLVLVYALFATPFITYWPFAMSLIILLGIAFSLVPSALWPSVAKIMPLNRLGTAYALIFWMQNLGLAGVPYAVSLIRDKYCIVRQATASTSVVYDYTLPMLIFMSLGLAAIGLCFLLRIEDRRKGYGLQHPSRG